MHASLLYLHLVSLAGVGGGGGGEVGVNGGPQNPLLQLSFSTCLINYIHKGKKPYRMRSLGKKRRSTLVTSATAARLLVAPQWIAACYAKPVRP